MLHALSPPPSAPRLRTKYFGLYTMFINYLKIAVRNLLRHKGYAIVNIGGLAVGLACTLLILLWVRDELSFDRFHSDAERIYRLNWDFKYDNNEGLGSGTPPPL